MIKKMLGVAILSCIAFVSVNAQKVDLDRHYIKIPYTNLPTEPILNESFRTYSVSSNESQVTNEIKIYGFEKLSSKATLMINIQVDNVTIDNIDISKREKVNKDKEGNVTSVDRFYTPVIRYKTSGSYSIANSQGKPHNFRLGSKKTYKGNEYNSYNKAAQFYKLNSENLRSKFKNDFINESIAGVNGGLNSLYGYAPYTSNELFWILDSKKNDDYEGHQKALADIKTLLAKVKRDESIEELKAEIKPIEDYLMSIIPKYQESKKKHRKMRYATYYNLGRLYYQFDMPDKAIEMANKLIENDYDKSDGKRLIKESNALKEAFKINQVTTRHFPVETVDNSEVAYNDVASIQESAPKPTVADKYIDVVYDKGNGNVIEGKLKLKGDVDLNNLDLTKSHKNIIRIYSLNEEGAAQDVGYFAKENSYFKANGATYEAVKFAPNDDGSNDGVASVGNSAKYLFAKVIYKGKKLSLYRYKNELVLKKTGDKKGQSTKALAYVIGFKKKLSKLVSDCAELAALAKDGSFSNDEDSLLVFVTQYNEECK